jgi:demethoxyubiquinone hydroxylase (CLK1/Coq7/Cat5 family)
MNEAELDNHYKQQISKMENEHKAFLEEIDKMMVD